MTLNTERTSATPHPHDDTPSGAISMGVFIPALALVVAVLVWGLVFTDSFQTASVAAFGWTAKSVDWMFIFAATTFVAFILWLAFSKYGTVRLGGDDETPRYRTSSWISMMFAAGMGIGLMFYGVSEPLAHFRETPPNARPGVTSALATTTFHWTAHAWAVYAVVGLALALTTYRYGGRHLISSAFTPLIGEKRAKGWPSKVLDVLAIFATVFGTAASLGLGALQIRSGLEQTGAVTGESIAVVVGIIVVLGLCFVASAISGIDRGIQWLSNINMVLAVALALFVLIASGSAVFILDLIPTSIGSYFGNFFDMASRTGASADGTAGDWLSSWTVFYWAWWISWSPFVGMFLARISRGRTIREFVVGVLVVPSALSIVWFSIFGGAALDLELKGRSIYGEGDSTEQLFTLFRELPFTGVLAVVAMVLVGIFFITGADSASIIMAGMSQYGVEEPKRWLVVLWGALTASVAVLMLLPGLREGEPDSALTSLQNLTIIAASPFVLILIALCVSIVKALSRDPFITEKVYLLPKSERDRRTRVDADVRSGGTSSRDGAATTPSEDGAATT
ncbi:BCCT family transporter [Rhodococcus sp. IEGM 1408]|uniref:BCCT family transporter n=1 Tax=Rhodococcus sp. IEGM 1408 TaxID=3082220 RepID=UPI0029532082|nr:BCCT family transporter [Rhodococcus sp. IEGM 1408]MDV8001102.1 BCCT family transporter [Rhodococcus sp. IEGM 1408]